VLLTITKLKLLIGTLSPIKGTVERHSRLRIGYFDQLSVERLSSPEISKVSALTYFIEALEAGSPSVQLDEGSGRRILGSFGLGGRKATDPIVGLSGGQKASISASRL
jgi:ATPase subunit of ABC transporter with duplicated ATPase domains